MMNDKIIEQGIRYGYEAVRNLTDRIFAVRLGYKWGLVDENNNELMPIIYDYISYEDRLLWARFKGYKFNIPIEWLPLKYDCIYYYGEKGCAKVIKNGKCGVVDNQYNELIPCWYDDLYFRKKVIQAKRKANNNTNNGNTVDIFSYDGTLLMGEVFFPSMFGNIIGKKEEGCLKYGIIDENYNIVIPCENKSIKCLGEFYDDPFYDDPYKNHIEIEQEGGFHYIWIYGTGLIDIGYDKLELIRLQGDYHPLLYCYRKKEYPSYKDKAKKLLFEMSHHTDAYGKFSQEEYIDIYFKEKKLLSYNTKEIAVERHVTNGLFICKELTNGKYGLLCYEGCKTPFVYDNVIYDAHRKIVCGIRNAEYRDDEYVSSYDYSANKTIMNTQNIFYDGIVDIYDETGFLMRQGLQWFNIDFSKSSYWWKGYLRLCIDNGTAVFKDSKLIIHENEYDEIEHFFKDSFGGLYEVVYAVVKKNGKYGVVNSDGQLQIPIEYDKIEDFNPQRHPGGYSNSFLYAQIEQKCAFFVADKNLKKLEYSYISKGKTNDGLFIVSKDDIPLKYSDLKSLSNYEGRRVVDALLTKARHDERISAQPSNYQHLFGKIDAFGNEVFPCEFTIEEIQNKVLPKQHKKEYATLNIYNDFKTVKDTDTGKVGIMGNDDKFILECAYSSISVDSDLGMEIRSIRVSDEKGMTGIVDRTGQMLLPCKYHFGAMWRNINSLFYIVSMEDKFGIIDYQGVFIVPCVFPHLDFEYKLMKHNLVLVTENNKKGVIDLNKNNNYVLDCAYDSIDVLNFMIEKENKYLIAKDENLCRVLSLPDFTFVSEVNALGLTDIVIVRDNTIVVKIKESDNIKYQMFSISQKIVSGNLEFDEIGSFGEHYIQVRKNDKWGLFNMMTCEEEIPCEYYEHESNFMFNSDEGYAVIKKNGLYGFVNHNNQIIIDCSFCYAEPFSEGSTIVKTSGKIGCHYQSKYYKYSSRTEQIEDGTWGLVNLQGELIADGYEDIKGFKEGLAAAKKDGKWGYIDKQGRAVIPFIFAKAKSFSDGLAAVAFNSRYGYIDRHNKTIIPFKYIEADDFYEGLASVETSNDGYGEISKDGIVVEWKKTPSNHERDDYDYEGDTWDAMTDGQYGDMPDGFDGDYSFLGY